MLSFDTKKIPVSTITKSEAMFKSCYNKVDQSNDHLFFKPKLNTWRQTSNSNGKVKTGSIKR